MPVYSLCRFILQRMRQGILHPASCCRKAAQRQEGGICLSAPRLILLSLSAETALSEDT